MNVIVRLATGYLREKGYTVCTEADFISAFGTLNNELVKRQRTIEEQKCIIKALKVTVERQELK